MLHSLNSGVSGLHAHQEMVDVVGNNIANVNTTAFRASTVQFADVLSQTSKAGSAGTSSAGGTNPVQVGLGVRVVGVTTSDTPGSLQNTGRSTDLALQGDGFLGVRIGNEVQYTRAGALSFDSSGRLVDASGGLVQGWMARPGGKVDPTTPTGDLVFGDAVTAAAKATTSVSVGGNLSADAAVGDQLVTGIDVYDNLGSSHRVTLTLTKSGPNTWDQSAVDDKGTALTPGTVTLTVDPTTGQLASASPAPTYTVSPAGVPPVVFAVDFGTPGESGALTGFGGESTAAATKQDGQSAGTLRNVSIADGGLVIGTFSNGTTQSLGQVSVTTFANAKGLEKTGDNHYRAGLAAGAASVGVAGTGQRGTLVAGALESSNVDLGQELTNMIIGQRGFQANSKTIQTADELLNDLVNLKR